MSRWVRYVVIAALGVMAFVGVFCSGWIDKQLAECPTTWSACEHSFAYVTRVDTDYMTAADEAVRVDRCDVVGRLPLQKLDETPSGDAERWLDGATRIDTREDDHDRVCKSWLHTWQAVVYDPQHRDHARFASLPKRGGFGLRKLLLVLVIALCLGYPIWSRYGGRIWGRIWGWFERLGAAWNRRGVAKQQRRRERAKRKRKAFYAEIRAESAKIEASVAEDEAAKRARDAAE